MNSNKLLLEFSEKYMYLLKKYKKRSIIILPNALCNWRTSTKFQEEATHMSECYYSYYSLINPIRKALNSTDKPELKELWHKMSHDVACDGKDAKKAIHLLTEDPLSKELMTAIQHFDYHMPWELENVIRFQFRKTNYEDAGPEIVHIQDKRQIGGHLVLNDHSRYVVLLIENGGNGEVNVWEKRASS